MKASPTQRSPQRILDGIEDMLIQEGYVALEVDLGRHGAAHFWVKAKELWVHGPWSKTQLPYFDPSGLSEDQLRDKVRLYLTFS